MLGRMVAVVLALLLSGVAGFGAERSKSAEDAWVRPGDVHYNKTGSAVQGDEVACTILGVLSKYKLKLLFCV